MLKENKAFNKLEKLFNKTKSKSNFYFYLYVNLLRNS